MLIPAQKDDITVLEHCHEKNLMARLMNQIVKIFAYSMTK